MTPQQFVQNTNGKAVTYDGIQANYGQCEQLVCLFWRYVYGFLCPPVEYAKDLITNPTVLAKFNVIPTGKEQAWDVAVFGASVSINSPVAGHTDIVLEPGFTGWDSNWGGVTDGNKGTAGYGYPAAHEVQHTYNDVIGFLRFKEGVEQMPVTTAQIQDVGRSYHWEPDQNYLNVWSGTDSFQNMWYDLSAQPAVKAAMAAFYATQSGDTPTVLEPGKYQVN